MLTNDDLNERAAAIIGVDIDELIEHVRTLSVEYGKQKAKVEYMENLRKTCLYSVIEDRRAEFSEAGEKMTEARLESIARASQAYKTFLKQQYEEKVLLVEAEAQYFAERNRLDSTMEKMKLLRSEQYLHAKN